MVEMQTRASFQPMTRDWVQAAARVVMTVRRVPRVTPLRPATWVVSVERNDVRAPAVFSSRSKKATSWRSMVRKARSRTRCTRRSEHLAKMMPWVAKERNCTMPSIRYIRHQKDVSRWMVGMVSALSCTDMVVMSLAKKTACTGLPPPQMMAKKKPTLICFHLGLLKLALSLMSVQRLYLLSWSDSALRPCSARLDADLCVDDFFSLSWMLSSSGSAANPPAAAAEPAAAAADPSMVVDILRTRR